MILSCEDLSLGYEGKAVWEHLSFSIDAGAYLCIVGANGSGKSTLIKGLLHLRPPMAGKIRLGEGLRTNEIGYLPQQSSRQKDFPASAEEVVLSGCINQMGGRPFYNRQDRKRARQAMAEMGVENLRKRCYQELSGGQQQRVLLARALCATGKLLLLDEPVAGLDPEAAREMYDRILTMNRQKGITVLMVSHDIKEALQYATHVLHLERDGYFFGTREEYEKSPLAGRWLGGEADVANAN